MLGDNLTKLQIHHLSCRCGCYRWIVWIQGEAYHCHGVSLPLPISGRRNLNLVLVDTKIHWYLDPFLFISSWIFQHQDCIVMTKHESLVPFGQVSWISHQKSLWRRPQRSSYKRASMRKELNRNLICHSSSQIFTSKVMRSESPVNNSLMDPFCTYYVEHQSHSIPPQSI